jgi:hypothetical protein
MKTTLSEIQKLIDKLALQIQVPQYLLPMYGNNLEGSHVEIDKKGALYYFAIERGEETYRYLASDVDDLLYRIFEGATLMMASDYELKNRIKGQSFRRILFYEQERLLGVLDEKWRLRSIQNHEQILIKNPFDDNSSERATYYQQLIKSGQHLGSEWSLAYEKYPPLDKNQT